MYDYDESIVVKEQNKMTWFEYYFTHVIPTGWRTIGSAFKMWCDLMTGNYDDYVLLPRDNPFEECYAWFWATLGEDDIYPKEFLEYLNELCYQVETGEMKTVPMDRSMFDELEELVGDLISEDD